MYEDFTLKLDDVKALFNVVDIKRSGEVRGDKTRKKSMETVKSAMSDQLLSVINFLLKKADEESLSLTHLKLQKLLYFAWGIHWIEHKKSLFEDDFESWRYGHFIPNVYHKYKSFGASGINKQEETKAYPKYALSEEERASLEETWRKFGNNTSLDFVNETHQSNMTWDISGKESKLNKELTKAFFESAHLIKSKYMGVLERLAKT